MDGEVNKEIVSFLSHSSLPAEEGSNGQIKEGREQRTDLSRTRVNKDQIERAGSDYGANEQDYFDPSNIKQEPIKVAPKIGRNDPCPCGSGKKFKQCHGKDA